MIMRISHKSDSRPSDAPNQNAFDVPNRNAFDIPMIDFSFNDDFSGFVKSASECWKKKNEKRSETSFGRMEAIEEGEEEEGAEEEVREDEGEEEGEEGGKK